MRPTIPLLTTALFLGTAASPAAEPPPPPQAFARDRPGAAGEASPGGATADPDKTAGRVDALIARLGDPEFARREAAGRELDAIGEPAWYPLRRALASSPDPEVRARARCLVHAIARREFVEIRRFSGTQYGYWVNRVLFTPDGKQVVATGGGVITYDPETGRELRRTMELQYARRGLALTRDGRHFLTGHQREPVVRLGELATGKQVGAFEGHVGGVRGVALSPDESRAASAGDDGTVRVWDVKAGKELHRLRAPGGADCVAFSPDGRRLASGHYGPGSGNLVRLWDAETGREVRRLEAHGGDVKAVAYLPDGRTLLSAGMDGTLRLWDVETGMEVRRLDHDSGGVFDAAVSPDGRRALSAGFGDRTVRLWDLSDGLELLRLHGHQAAALSVAFSPDGRRALTGDARYTVRLWRLPSPEQPRK